MCRDQSTNRIVIRSPLANRFAPARSGDVIPNCAGGRIARAGQPTAGSLCFAGFRARAPFRSWRDAAKCGGAGARSGGGGHSGSGTVEGSTRVRTSSEEVIGADCMDLWWSSIHRASKASEVSWIHWSINAAISSRRLAAWFKRVSS